MSKYTEYEGLDLTNVAEKVAKKWKEQSIFKQSIDHREGAETFVFYEGPPSANGMPGIHHVMGRTIKDIIGRYKTLAGYRVPRKAGWDTHGLPVELAVEKDLGITKEDIGKTISVEEYNQACRKAVMKYTDVWDDLTEKMGYWVDLDDPYITYENKYIESVWHLLKQLYNTDYLYKGYTIQPYSPAAGTGLSTHELNQPGCYKMVKDTTIVAQFKVVADDKSKALFEAAKLQADEDLFFMAWTTTPWTLPSNTALCFGPKIRYNVVKTFNQYTHLPITVVVAENRTSAYFPEMNADLTLGDYKAGDKQIPFEIVGNFSGAELAGIRYEQLLPYAQPEDGDAFRAITGDFVTTEDGTGIVHIAPSFGADDKRVAQLNGIGSLTLVDLQGKFLEVVSDFPGEYVKEAYFDEIPEGYLSVDVRIAIKLKEENKAFKVEKYEHSYPHCWRTDKPILYYPLDSWFVKTTKARERLIELNNTINWKPAATGTGRFGNWLENLQDWNLSRSRFWGIPIPIWSSEDGEERICIGSVEELKSACEKSVAAGVMSDNPLADYQPGDMSQDNYDVFDLHRPFVDDIVLVSDKGTVLKREADLIDVWFDSGSMPYAQLHYPFENKELFQKNYPADFIAEGVDQTRGWFFTLHAIATLCFDSVAFKNVVSNGLVLDKNGQKMSKRYGNAVDPFETLKKYGPDATRWYMITNAQPWDNLKFDPEGITEVQRKFFRALNATYSFLALYGNVDGFEYAEAEIPVGERPELDRWILSKLNSLITEVTDAYDSFEPTRAGRAIQDFVVDHLSNWYVRLCRRRFWKGDYSTDKIAAYQTLYTCLEKLAVMSAPIAPFYSDQLYTDLNAVTGKSSFPSVHLADFPKADQSVIDKGLESRMELAQRLTSMVLSLRKKEKVRVRQPLNRILVPVLNDDFKAQLDAIEELLLSELNVKTLEKVDATSGIFKKKVKANFKLLGPKYGKNMKQVAAGIAALDDAGIAQLEQEGSIQLDVNGESIAIALSEVEVQTEDMPGWLVASESGVSVALDIQLTPELIEEGLAREFVNRIQNLRKDAGLEVTDRIDLRIKNREEIGSAITNNLDYICSETLANSLELVDEISPEEGTQVEVETGVDTWIAIDKQNL